MKYIKKFENSYIKKKLEDIDLMDIENLILEHIDKGSIKVTDYIETDRLKLEDVIGIEYSWKMNSIHPLFYPDEFGSKYNTKKFSWREISGVEAKAIKVELLDKDISRNNLDINGYTRGRMKYIFKKLDKIYDVSSYIVILSTNYSGNIISESLIIFE